MYLVSEDPGNELNWSLDSVSCTSNVHQYCIVGIKVIKLQMRDGCARLESIVQIFHANLNLAVVTFIKIHIHCLLYLLSGENLPFFIDFVV